MADVTREQLYAYLDDALDDAEAARIEKLIRGSAAIRTRLSQVREERDRGEHSLGAVWRRERLSCPTREQLSRLLARDPGRRPARLRRVSLANGRCPSCQANLDDLKEKQAESAAQARRRRRYLSKAPGYSTTSGSSRFPVGWKHYKTRTRGSWQPYRNETQ